MNKLGYLAAVAILFAAGCAFAAGPETKEPAKAQTTCPITGKVIDKTVYVDYQGKRVYFCCPACPATFNKDPEKYVKKMEAEGVTLEAVGKPQTVCPVMGGKIDKKVFVDYQGKRIYFCCSMCPPKFKEDPEKYIKKMEAEGVVLEKTPEPDK